MLGWHCRNPRHRGGARFTAVALAAVLIAAGPGDALAAAPAWKIQSSPDATLPGGQIQSVSCPAANACVAVGTYLDSSGINRTLAERWNGKAWQLMRTPSPAENTVPAVSPDLLGVSCPALNFCTAVGAYHLGISDVVLAYEWNGHSWAPKSFPFPRDSDSAELNQVSCTSARFCEAVGSYATNSATVPLAAIWNGTSWHLQTAVTPAGSGLLNFTTVSCPTSGFCEALGGGNAGNPAPPFAERWDGKAWHLQKVPASLVATSVSCASARFCEAVADDSSSGLVGAELWNGSTWREQVLSGPGGSLTAISCASVTACEAVGFYQSDGQVVGEAESWNGKKWTSQPTPDPAGAARTDFDAVSCHSAKSCEAGGYFNLNETSSDARAMAQTWNGRSWQVQSPAAPPGATTNSLSAVSCVSSSFCAAVGSHLDGSGNTVALVEAWNGLTWKAQFAPSTASSDGSTTLEDLQSVSCISASFCEAVGTGSAGANAEMWNGVSWRLQKRPGADVQPMSVSCATVDFCLTVDGSGEVAIWNGSTWAAGPSATGISSLRSVSCVSASFCEAVGFGPAGQSAVMWNGSSWTAQPVAGPTSVALNAVACPAINACEAVGSYTNSSFQQVTLAEAWNGSAWTMQASPNPLVSQGNSLAAVSCTSAASCTAVGQYQYSNLGLTSTLAEVWNGTVWSLQSTPNTPDTGQNILSGVSCAAARACAAVGITQDVGLIPATLVETGG